MYLSILSLSDWGPRTGVVGRVAQLKLIEVLFNNIPGFR